MSARAAVPNAAQPSRHWPWWSRRQLTLQRKRLLTFGLTVAGIFVWVPYILAFPVAIDAHAYYVGEYGIAWMQDDAYVYSPAFSQAVEPLRWLGWDGFRTVWRSLEVLCLAYLAGPFTGLLLFVTAVALEVNLGNIHLLMAVVVALGFRYPALWSFVLLTKVTPGIGLLWFAVRREWRNLGIALGATAAIAGVSFLVNPGLWFDWLAVLRNPGGEDVQLLLTLPLPLRILLAAGLVVWGARSDHRWTVLVAAFIAMPAVWLMSAAMLVGLMRRPQAEDRRAVETRRPARGIALHRSAAAQ